MNGRAYREFPLDPGSAQILDAMWSFTTLTEETAIRESRPHCVLPDGCVDLIVRYSPALATPSISPRCELLVSGPLFRFKYVHIQPGTMLWGVQIRPGWTDALLGVPAEFLPTTLEPAVAHLPDIARTAEMLQAAARAGAQEVEDVLLCAVHHMVYRALDIRSRTESRRSAPWLNDAIVLMHNHHGQIRISEIADSLGLSDRTVHRQMRRTLGMPPKTFARILRFQRALTRLQESSMNASDLATLAVEAGYADQAHMTHEFRTFSGTTPSTYTRLADARTSPNRN